MSASSRSVGAAGGGADAVDMFDSRFQTVVASPKKGSLQGLFGAAAAASDDDKMKTVVASPQRAKVAALFANASAAASCSPVTPPSEHECAALRQQILDLNKANESKTEDAQALQRTLRDLQDQVRAIEESAPKTVIRRVSPPSVADAFPEADAPVAKAAKGAAAAAPVTPPTDDDERPKLRAQIRDFHTRNGSLDVTIRELTASVKAAQEKLAKLKRAAAKA